jgi:uncharacterized membrane protein YgdD (TMEM256/DUF423 family)
MNRNLAITSFLGAMAILLGAFGAHALKEIVTSEGLKSFEIAVRYQMYHVIVLLFVNADSKFMVKDKNIISFLFFVGIVLFSGSIYAITLGINPKSIWFITPLGGLLFILGWVKMIFLYLKKT